MSTQGQTPNILLIIADDLGQDLVNITGSGTKRVMQVYTNDGTNDIYGALPNISRFLRNGLYFSEAWAQPACSTTRASIFTGWHPWKNGVGSPPGELVYKSGLKTLPQLLPSNYVSGLFGKWHLGSLEVDGTLPTDHGWDRFVGTLDGFFDETKMVKKLPESYTNWYIQDSQASEKKTAYEEVWTNNYATWREVNEAASWINAQTTPWFATIAFHTPHKPLHVPTGGYDTATVGKPAVDKNPSDAYMFNVMAQNMDFYIGNLLGTVGGSSLFKSIEENRLNNTIIIFIGDNGSDKAVALEEEKNYIYEGSVRVPMIIADGYAVMREIKKQTITPRYLYASRLNATCGLLAHVVDLYKTIVHLVNPAENGFSENTDSVSFRDVVADPLFALNAHTGQKRTFNFSQYYKGSTKLATIRTTGYKLNYDDSAQAWALYKYSDGEIPGREDPATAAAANLALAAAIAAGDGAAIAAATAAVAALPDDIFTDAIKLVNIGAGVNLNDLLNNLIANYQLDETHTFPDPR
jgi:arylsulfatase A-like enzyme